MAIAISIIESAVKRVYSELIKSQEDTIWVQMSEEQLLFELISCILGSQVPYELALAAAHEIRQADLLKMPTQKYTLNEYENYILKILKTPVCYQSGSLTSQKYRFPKTKANPSKSGLNGLATDVQPTTISDSSSSTAGIAFACRA